MEQAKVTEKKAVLLSAVESGTRVKVLQIDAGHGLRSRLTAMGILPNTEITVVKNSHSGPFVLNVKGSKIVLGRGMAHKIVVTRI